MQSHLDIMTIISWLFGNKSNTTKLTNWEILEHIQLLFCKMQQWPTTNNRNTESSILYYWCMPDSETGHSQWCLGPWDNMCTTTFAFANNYKSARSSDNILVSQMAPIPPSKQDTFKSFNYLKRIILRLFYYVQN